MYEKGNWKLPWFFLLYHKGEKRSQVDVCWEKMLQDKSMLDELDMYDPVFLPFIIISFTSEMIYRSIKSTLLFKIVCYNFYV